MHIGKTIRIIIRPQAVDDTADISIRIPSVVIPVLANDSDPDGDPLSVVAVTQPDLGVVTINPDGTLTYTLQSGGIVGTAYGLPNTAPVPASGAPGFPGMGGGFPAVRCNESARSGV